MENSIETLEQQTAPESTRGLFDDSSLSSDNKFPQNRRESAPTIRRGSLGNTKPTTIFNQPARRGHQRSRSSSDLFNNLNINGRRNNNFGLQTLVEEEANTKSSSSNLDSLQDMINTLKNLPPVISSSSLQQHRKQQSMSVLVSNSSGHGNGNNKRMSYNNHSRRSSSTSLDNNNNNNIFNTLSRDEALAEAEAKLMGTFSRTTTETKKLYDGGNRRGSIDSNNNNKYSLQGGRRYSEAPIAPLSSSTSSTLSTTKRTSLPMPTLNENMVSPSSSRRIQFNKPLNLSSATITTNTKKEEVDNKRISAGGGGNHQRKSSRNLDSDWRSSSSTNIITSTPATPTSSSFQLVPFTPTRVNFARDDANPHQRRPLFIAHLPFSVLPPLFRSRQLSRGTLRVNKRNRSDAYVYCEDLDDDIYICGSRDRNRALEGDVVAVRLADVDKVLREKKEKEEAKWVRNGGQAKLRLPDEEDENEIIFGGEEDVDLLKPKYCGVVVAILERAQNQVFSGTLTLMRPNNKRAQEEKAAEEARRSILGKDILIEKKEAPRIVWFKSTDKRVPLIAIPIEQAPHDFVENSEAYNTTLFVGSMKRWPITSLHPFGTLECQLGSVYELDTQTKAILADNNVTHSDFSEAVQSCLPSIPFKLEHVEPSRRDLRQDVIFTIDPKGSNVLDDALSIKKLNENTWEVGVHISDVTYFIKSQSALDKEARARGVRVDLIHTHVPMIPEILTEQVTNLSPNESRFTFSVIFTITNKGEILDTWFGKTIIKSCAQLTYEDAQKIIEETTTSEQLAQDIHALHQLSITLYKQRQIGIFTQKRDELQYEFQDQEPITVSIHHKNEAENMVKEFLYLTNKSVAQRISSHLPDHALLRRHALPSQRKIKELCDYTSRHLGVHLDTTNAGTLETSIQAIQDPKLRKLVSILVLKTLQAPRYFCAGSVDISKYAHYSLHIPLYTHFTAPSRRFADLIVHRQLEVTLMEGVGEKRFSLDRDTVQKLAQHCNVKKEASMGAREQSSLMFLSIHMNKLSLQQSTPSVIFREAIVVAVFDQYFDVMIPELNLEKRIHLACLPVWRSDYNNQSLTMFWRKGADTSTGKKVDWSISNEEEEDDDEMDDEALLEEMNQHTKEAVVVDEKQQEEEEEEIVLEDYKNTIYSSNESVVSSLSIKHHQAASLINTTATADMVVPNKSISTPAVLMTTTSRRASIVRARLSDSTAFSTEQGFQTIKALDKIRVVLIMELARTPPVIRILAANPFS